MEAIVLAGGFGTRLREVVQDVPKPMAPIGDKPFLEILLKSLADKGFEHIILSLGFMADKVIRHFGNSYMGMSISFVVEDKPLGTGGAIRLAMTKCTSDHVYIFNGDTFLDLEVIEIERQWQKNHRPIIVGRHVPDTGRYGKLLVDDGCVKGFSEKGEDGPGLINAGCYVFKTDFLDKWAVNNPFSLENEFLVKVVTDYPIDCFETSGLFIDIGVPDDFHRAQNLLANYI